MKKIIAIDIGNTETTVGIGNKDGWDSYRFTTRDTNTPDELLALFNSTFNLIEDKRNELAGSIVCSVVSNTVSPLRRMTATSSSCCRRRRPPPRAYRTPPL